MMIAIMFMAIVQLSNSHSHFMIVVRIPVTTATMLKIIVGRTTVQQWTTDNCTWGKEKMAGKEQ